MGCAETGDEATRTRTHAINHVTRRSVPAYVATTTIVYTAAIALARLDTSLNAIDRGSRSGHTHTHVWTRTIL